MLIFSSLRNRSDHRVWRCECVRCQGEIIIIISSYVIANVLSIDNYQITAAYRLTAPTYTHTHPPTPTTNNSAPLIVVFERQLDPQTRPEKVKDHYGVAPRPLHQPPPLAVGVRRARRVVAAAVAHLKAQLDDGVLQR